MKRLLVLLACAPLVGCSSAISRDLGLGGGQSTPGNSDTDWMAQQFAGLTNTVSTPGDGGGWLGLDRAINDIANAGTPTESNPAANPGPLQYQNNGMLSQQESDTLTHLVMDRARCQNSNGNTYCPFAASGQTPETLRKAIGLPHAVYGDGSVQEYRVTGRVARVIVGDDGIARGVYFPAAQAEPQPVEFQPAPVQPPVQQPIPVPQPPPMGIYQQNPPPPPPTYGNGNAGL
jgi:hypothetical protein